MTSTLREPDSDFKPIAKRLLTYVKPYRGGLALTIGAYVGAACTEPLIPKLIQTVFGDGFKADAFSIWWVPVALIGLFARRLGAERRLVRCSAFWASICSIGHSRAA